MIQSQISTFLKKVIRKCGLMPAVSALDKMRCSVIKKWCVLTGRNPLEYIYNDSFFSVARHESVLEQTPKILAETVFEFYKPKQVNDFGCGCGIYLREFERLGAEVFGVDGSPAAQRNLAIDQNKFLLADLTKPVSVSGKYDCAISFEVAEHIPTSTSETLVNNITRASDLVVFTAAHIGQGGHDHINEQDPSFWVALFQKKGFEFLAEDTRKIRKALSDAGAIFWLVDNFSVFKKQ
ncbi:MAG: class I SAM-dependent methyltransferase [bacterium]|nr:class I SAM-dependent methyltransferase [bacterium]